jgi:ABC-2 type transport system ATP-binding protein
MEQAEKLCDHICLISRGRPLLIGELARIKRDLRGNTYRLVADGDLAATAELEGVESVVVDGGSARLILTPGAAGSQVLRALVQRIVVHEFTSEEPDLETIFIKAVQDAH